MKRKITLLLCLFVALAIVLTGCPKMNEPEPENTSSFIRTHSGNDAYKGFTEIYFDNVKSLFSNAVEVTVSRHLPGYETASGTTVYRITANAGSSINTLPSLIDYYVTPGTDYVYKLFFNYEDGTTFGLGSDVIHEQKGLGTVTFTQPHAVFNEETGILSFSTIPAFAYTPVNGFFDNGTPDCSLTFSCYDHPDYSNRIPFSDFATGELDVYSYFQSLYGDSILGDKVSFNTCSFLYKKTLSSCTIVLEEYYDSNVSSVSIPDVVTPPEYLRSYSGEEYDGYNEIYFDNLSEYLTQQREIYIQRKDDQSEWKEIYNIQTGNAQSISQPIVDYFADTGKTYQYRLYFSDSDTWIRCESITTASSKEKIELYQCSATYDADTGKLEFSTLPMFHFPDDSPSSTYSINLCYTDQNNQYEFAFPVTEYDLSVAPPRITGSIDIITYLRNWYPSYLSFISGKTLKPLYFKFTFKTNNESPDIRYTCEVNTKIEGLEIRDLPDITLPAAF